MRLPFPTNLAFEPIQVCNAACVCCPYSWLKDDPKYFGVSMSEENITKLLNQFGSCREQYHYDGKLKVYPFRFSDPLVCKDLELILDLCRTNKMNCQITTNAFISSKRWLQFTF